MTITQPHSNRDCRAGALPINLARPQQGFALLATMWIVSVMTAVLLQTSAVSRTAMLLAGSDSERAQLQLWVDGGIQRGLQHLVNDRTSADLELIEGDVSITVSVRNEAAKIDLNYAQQELLLGLFHSLSYSDEKANSLADSILDWRDPDDLRRPYGAEDDDYDRLGLSQRSGDRLFESTYELLKVAGLSVEDFVKIRDHVTVYSRRSTVYPPDATLVVLQALPGSTEQLVAEYDLQREQVNTAAKFPLQDRRFVDSNPSAIFNIRVRASASGHRVHKVGAVVTLDSRRADGPYRILDLRYGDDDLIVTGAYAAL